MKEMAALALLGHGEEEEEKEEEGLGLGLSLGGVSVLAMVGVIWRAGTRVELRFWMRDILGCARSILVYIV